MRHERAPVAAMAILAACAALALAGCGGGRGSSTSTVSVADSVAPGTTTAETGSCSSTGDARLPAQKGLPAPVSKTRQALANAAVDCDFDVLAGLAADSDRFQFAFGAPSGGPARYWRKADMRDRTLDRLARLLHGPYGRDEAGNFVWPAVHDASRHAPADWKALIATGAYPPAEVRQYQQRGGTGYLGYRIGIARDGSWQYYLAGD